MKLGAWYPLLALLGATRGRSYVDVDEATVSFRLGAWRLRVPRADVADAAPARWPWYGGIGWRIGPGTVGLIGSLANVVRVTLSPPHRTRVVFIPVKAWQVFVSLEDPQAFIADLKRAQG
jgi:hypothetical protein